MECKRLRELVCTTARSHFVVTTYNGDGADGSAQAEHSQHARGLGAAGAEVVGHEDLRGRAEAPEERPEQRPQARDDRVGGDDVRAEPGHHERQGRVGQVGHHAVRRHGTGDVQEDRESVAREGANVPAAPGLQVHLLVADAVRDERQGLEPRGDHHGHGRAVEAQAAPAERPEDERVVGRAGHADGQRAHDRRGRHDAHGLEVQPHAGVRERGPDAERQDALAEPQHLGVGRGQLQHEADAPVPEQHGQRQQRHGREPDPQPRARELAVLGATRLAAQQLERCMGPSCPSAG
ncbi:unnamed protein product [Phytophthora fragariaefolia]|uniref:Unnamed protein product n=1 Tax=Phytophthora fragariaefolia TaxID=1490495 RepID=A0A9W6Y511_9STRA|nr:unnamed protein product [Phytophthora fragariaefolia]